MDGAEVSEWFLRHQFSGLRGRRADASDHDVALMRIWRIATLSAHRRVDYDRSAKH
jgi:hypothetical protein